MKIYLYLMLLLFTAVTGGYFAISWAQLPAGHRFIYPLDDVYIHLALARNFAELGVWSVNISGFDSASSSILYTLLLSGLIAVFGSWEYYPLLLNVIFGYLTVYTLYQYFKDFYGARELQWGLVLFLPFSFLYVMVLIGMEHTIHMFLMVMAVYYIHRNVNLNFEKNAFRNLLVITFFLSMVRFESMFFTVSLAFALFLTRRFSQGLCILLAGSVAIIVFGIFSLHNGGYFFPNSVMVKGSYPSEDHVVFSWWYMLRDGILLNRSFYKCLLFPFIIIGFYLYDKYRDLSLKILVNKEILILVIVTTSLLHSLFAPLKYRYENYLMISVLMICIPLIANFCSNNNIPILRRSLPKIATLGSIAVVVLVSIYRFSYHHQLLKFSSRGINEQQIEMSKFLGEFYKGEKVIANDIGAISYFSHVNLLDIVGLGSTDIAKMIVKNKGKSPESILRKNQQYIQQYADANQYKVAVIYPEWFPNSPPKEWIPVAEWKISVAFGPAGQRIVFYACNQKEVDRLKKNLGEFERNLNVQQNFY